jgi:hypothetical protein
VTWVVLWLLLASFFAGLAAARGTPLTEAIFAGLCWPGLALYLLGLTALVLTCGPVFWAAARVSNWLEG